VIFSDISEDLLDHCHAAAAAEGLLDRSRFLLASADSLAASPTPRLVSADPAPVPAWSGRIAAPQ
jgi:hypothetical protein